MKNNKSTKSRATVSKGYRLRPSTHKLIKEVQLSLNATQDKIISMAMKLLRRKSQVFAKQKITK